MHLKIVVNLTSDTQCAGMSSLRERSLSVARAHMARPQHHNEKGQRQVGTPTIPTHYTKWLLANNASRGPQAEAGSLY